MAFTVGWPEGNSAVSVAYADSYFADRGLAKWTGDNAAKQGALVRATDYVRAMFSLRFDPDLFIPDLPEAFSKAICEYALVELVTPGGLAPAPQVDVSGYTLVTTKKKIGPIEKNFALAGGSSAKPLLRRSFPIPDALISSLLLPGLGLTRTIR